MTKKDYILIAAGFKASKPVAAHPLIASTWGRTVDLMADALQASNHRFDRPRFIAACGVAS